MKTFKMMKMAEQTGKIYKANDLHYSQTNGFTQSDRQTPWSASAFNSLNELLETENWEEIKEPVTWKEAIQAWMVGKSISCEINDRYGIVLYHFINGEYLINSISTPISLEMLQSGKWFIE